MQKTISYILKTFQQALYQKNGNVINITATFKKGSKKEACNYMPFSLTNILCKVLEYIVLEYLCKYMYMLAIEIFSYQQFRFLANRPTTVQLLKVINEWIEIPDEGDPEYLI